MAETSVASPASPVKRRSTSANGASCGSATRLTVQTPAEPPRMAASPCDGASTSISDTSSSPGSKCQTPTPSSSRAATVACAPSFARLKAATGASGASTPTDDPPGPVPRPKPVGRLQTQSPPSPSTHAAVPNGAKSTGIRSTSGAAPGAPICTATSSLPSAWRTPTPRRTPPARCRAPHAATSARGSATVTASRGPATPSRSRHHQSAPPKVSDTTAVEPSTAVLSPRGSKAPLRLLSPSSTAIETGPSGSLTDVATTAPSRPCSASPTGASAALSSASPAVLASRSGDAARHAGIVQSTLAATIHLQTAWRLTASSCIPECRIHGTSDRRRSRVHPAVNTVTISSR